MRYPRMIRSARIAALVVGAAVLGLGTSAHAFEIQTGASDLRMRWDNTLKYSAGLRLKDRSDVLTGDINYDDGDRNFDRGLISSRVDWLTEFDVHYKDIGARISAAAWYDWVYNKSNDNDSPFTNNGTHQASNRFPEETRRLHGRDAEVLDAFVFGNFDLGGLRTNLRLGQHTLVYGETLYFGANGIADAQGPIDLVKLLTVPNSQFKEVLRPVPQVSGTLQLNPRLSLGAYYQFRWTETRLAGVGSYLSNVDWVGPGTQSFLVGIDQRWNKIADVEPRDSGQGGLQLRWSPETGGFEYGLYFAQYHAKTPSGFYLDPVGETIRSVYHQDIRTLGASATTSIGQLNVALEASMRANAPLNSDAQVSIGQTADNDDHILYAVGRTAHANLSGLYALRPMALWEGGTLLCEVAWNRVLSVTKNPGALDPNTTRDAAALRLTFSPAYFQVLPGLDLEVPIGLGYNFYGRSGAVASFNGGSSNGGDFSLGVSGTYQNAWKLGLNYVHYLGDAFSLVTPQNSSTPSLSFGQTLKDRDFITFNVQRTF
jgi:hypothetical protein